MKESKVVNFALLILAEPSPGLSPKENTWIELIAFSFFVLLVVCLVIDGNRMLRRSPPPLHVERFAAPPPEEMDWVGLKRRADFVVQETVSSLPAELRPEAEKVSCIFQTWSHEIFNRRLLGVYMAFGSAGVSVVGGPIILFLGEIWFYSDRCGRSFEEQVKITYLHELGRHFGFNEEDLERRGLR